MDPAIQQFQTESFDYFKNNNINGLLEGMIKSLNINQPEDPVSYLIDYLERPVQKILAVIGIEDVTKPCKALAKKYNLKLINVS